MIDTGKDKYIATDADTNTALALNKRVATQAKTKPNMNTKPTPLIKKSQTNLNNQLKKYPTQKVIGNYLFYGGPIGGGLIGLLIWIGSGELRAILIVPIAMIIGLGLGLIPATLTGVFAAYFKVIRNPQGLALVTITGAFITIIYTLIAFMMMREGIDIVGVTLSAGILGGLSALITGLLFLPKPTRLQT